MKHVENEPLPSKQPLPSRSAPVGAREPLAHPHYPQRPLQSRAPVVKTVLIDEPGTQDEKS